MLFFLILLFTVVPVVELYLLFKAGAIIGGMNTIAIVILTGIIGAHLARRQGTSLFREVQTDINGGKIPASGLIQGFLILAGGLLLMTPGFVTDILGFSMVIPLTRIIWAHFLLSTFTRMAKSGSVKFYSSGSFGNGPRPGGPFGGRGDGGPFGRGGPGDGRGARDPRFDDVFSGQRPDSFYGGPKRESSNGEMKEAKVINITDAPSKKDPPKD